MAAVPDPSSPGDAPAPDDGATQDAPAWGTIARAAISGHDLGAIADYLGGADRPSLAELWGGGSIVGQEAPKAADQDKINEGAGPIGEAVLGAAAGGAAVAARGAVALGSTVAGDVVADTVNTASSRAAALGVKTTTEGLTAKTDLDFAAADALDALNKTVGNKWVRRGAAIAASQGAFWNPGGTGYSRKD